MKLPIIQGTGQRQATMSEDDILINCYAEQLSDGRYAAIKRKGVEGYSNPGTPGVCRGMWYWNGQLVSVFGSKLFHNAYEIGTNAIAGSGPCWAAAYGTSTKYLAISNGTNGYQLDTSWSLTSVSGGAYQAHVHGLVHIDGYLCTLSANGVLAHSAIRDFTSWSSTDTVNAEAYSDGGVALARTMNYILAIGTNTIEPFYDAANVNASAFTAVTGGLITIGCANARTLASIKEMPIFVSDGGAVYLIAEMKPERISARWPAIERIITGATLTDAFAMTFEYAGHSFYVLTLPTTNVTLAYDLTTQRWFQIQDPSGNYWPYVNAVQNGMSVYFQNADGKIYTLSGWQDNGANFTVKARTPWVDFGTGRIKLLPRVEVFSDLAAGDISLRYSKDDFANWSTARTASLSGSAVMRNFGAFKRIALELSHTHNEELRLIEVELDVVGSPGAAGAG
jgi:hypothetical protein